MSAATPPPTDGHDLTADYVSSNGAASKFHANGVRRLAALGYITAVAMPPIGLILGIVLATRSDKAITKHGVCIIAISIIAAIVWVIVFASGALTSTTNESGY
jgi:hypothetical protein